MLTADLVMARRQQGVLSIPAIEGRDRQSLIAVAATLIEICQAHEGLSRGQLLASWDGFAKSCSRPKRVKGLRKLLLDRCEFEDASDIDPRAVRKSVFRHASALRREAPAGGAFERDAALQLASVELDTSPEVLERVLYSDLKENHRLLSVEEISADALVQRYEQSSRQAVLLRATRVRVTLRGCGPAEYRAFFGRLKFRRLLYTIAPLEDGGFKIDIDGPFSLFQSVTKYGLQLALLLPALEACTSYSLEADIAWGKHREHCCYRVEGGAGRASGVEGEGASSEGAIESHVSSEVMRLCEQLSSQSGDWTISIADEILNLPGHGLCVPDLRCVHRDSGKQVFVEVMGYWSRQAVWRRVELAEAGLEAPIIFAVSQRLRVSEQVLGDELPSQLYVYKGVMSARAIADRLAHYVG